MVYWLFLVSLLLQCAYALCIFSRIFFLRSAKKSGNSITTPVSIIICAKNEAANLKKYLPSVLAQQYHNSYNSPLFEVIVVDDGSADDTPQVLDSFKQTYPNLKVVSVSQSAVRAVLGKKHALSIGVENASYNWLLLTDADCMPASNQWLKLMTQPLACDKEIVAGYGGYFAASGLLNAFVRWETMHTFLQYSTYTLSGWPYMAVGRNLACTKEVLQKAMQHEKWSALPSGDDDLLISIAGNNTNTAIVSDEAAFTYTDARATWTEWVHQKQRHLSTGKLYRPYIKILLALYAVSHAAFWLTSFVLLAYRCEGIISVMAVRCIVYWALWGYTSRRLGEKKLFYLFPLFDIGWMVYNFAFFPFITWKNKSLWK